MTTHAYPNQARYLSVLNRAPAEAVKQFADALIPELGTITVLQNRTGLVMLPMTETVKGETFYLGEALVAEARVQIGNGSEGYAACLGRDLEQALAIALIDAASAAGLAHERIDAFVAEQSRALDDADRELLRYVEATRVEMETF